MHFHPTHPPSGPSLHSLLRAEIERRDARRQQNTLLGFLAGFMAMSAGAAVATGLAGLVGRPLPALLIAGGALTGAAVRFFGRGVHWFFPAMAAGLSLSGWAAASLLAAWVTRFPEGGQSLAASLAGIHSDAAVTQLLQGLGPADFACGLFSMVLAWALASNRPGDPAGFPPTDRVP